jgi:hypothetical protein
VVFREAGAFCSRCVPKSLRDASWLAISSAVLGFLALGCGPLGFASILLGVVDLVRIALGKAPREGGKLDAVGIGFGTLGLVIGAVIAYRLATGQVNLPDSD